MADKELDEPVGGEKAKKGFSIKVLLIGLPIFIVQLVAVYFITINLLLDKVVKANSPEGIDSSLVALEEMPADEGEGKSVNGEFIYPVTDIIVNPAGTDGERYVMMELGVDVGSEEELKSLETKGIILKDIVITKLSSKTLDEIMKPDFREKFKNEVIEAAKEKLKDIKINTIYYSKFVIN
ncbi:MAG: flagellar basal body protein FliL [Chlorobi bacterium]|nr:flagellar basal body protein FliL [Chlorobiota bacterium]